MDTYGSMLNGKEYFIYDFNLLTTSNLSDRYGAVNSNDLWGV